MSIEITADNILREFILKGTKKFTEFEKVAFLNEALDLLILSEYVKGPLTSYRKTNNLITYKILPKGIQFIQSGGFREDRRMRKEPLKIARWSFAASLIAVIISVISIFVN